MRKKLMVFIIVIVALANTVVFAGDKGNSGIADIEELSKISIANLPEGSQGAEILKAANERIGDPYSIEMRGKENYLDCSGLTQWAYAQVGIDIPSSAAEQARYAVDKNKVIAKHDIQPGDLIFWSYPQKERVSERFMKIGHVAIYAGDGMMIESAPSSNGVVYREVSVQGEPILYARLYV